MNKHYFLSIALSSLLLAGCGGGSSSSENNSSNTTSSEPPTTESVRSQCVIRSGNVLSPDIRNNCSFNVNVISMSGVRLFVPANTTVNAGTFYLVANACQAPLSPANSSITNNRCI